MLYKKFCTALPSSLPNISPILCESDVDTVVSAIAAGSIQYPANLATPSAFGACANAAALFCASLVFIALPAIFLTIFCATAKPVPY